MQTVWQDIRYGWRTLFRNKGFATIAVLTLALGIGGSTAIFSVINVVLLRPLPYKDADRLVNISNTVTSTGTNGIPVSYTKLTRIQELSKTLESVGGYFPINGSLTTHGVPEQIQVARATANFFDVLGVVPAQGRGFLKQEDEEGGANVAILTDSFWHSHFGGDPEIVGRTIPLDGQSVTVVGVLPASFRFPFLQPAPDIWVPRVFDSPSLGPTRVHSGASYLSVYGRLRPGESLTQSQAELARINETYKQDFPGYVDATKFVPEMTSLKESLVGPLRPSLLALLAAVGFVLLIGCVNVASLLLARAIARSREIAIRRALGASRVRLIRQLLTESLLLAAAGGALGLLLAWASVRLLQLLPPGTLPRVEEIRLDLRVLLFALLISCITGIAAGLVPALQAAGKNLHGMLKERGPSVNQGRSGGRTRAVLVVTEVAIAVVLLTGAGLLIRSFGNLMRVSLGLDPRNVMTFTMSLPATHYPQPAQQVEFYRRLVEQVETIPGVQSAGVISFLPFSGAFRSVYACPEGIVCQGIGKDPTIAQQQVSPSYFKTMRIPLIRGRYFEDNDRNDARRVVILNQTAAKHYFSDQDPIGRRVTLSRGNVPMEVVGVIGDVRFAGLNTPNSDEMYLPQAQFATYTMTLVVRSQSDPQALVAAVRRKVLELDGDLPFANVSSLEDVISLSVVQARITTQLSTWFAALALLLSAIGIYGVLAYSVTQRTYEVGIRMALGARRNDIVMLIVRQGMTLVLLAVTVGLLASLALTRFLASLLFGTGARDPLTFAVVAGLLVLVALCACYLPARRAASVNPVTALRSD